MLRVNLIANFLGQGWSALMQLAFVPVYIQFLGIEAYGLVGFFTVLHLMVALLDGGILATVNRTMARFTGGQGTAEEVRDLLRSAEFVLAGFCTLAAIVIALASGFIAGGWLQPGSLSHQSVQLSVMLMGVVVALRVMEGIYRASIIGLQRQVRFNVVYAFIVTLRNGGAALVVALISPTIEAFFIFQVIAGIVSIAVLFGFAVGALPKATRRGRFSWPVLKAAAPFAFGVFLISGTYMLYSQADKLLLPRLVGLADYGHYALASLATMALILVSGPLSISVIPRMNQLVARSDMVNLRYTFHLVSQLKCALLGTAALVLAAFAQPALTLWTGQADVAAATAPILTILVIGQLVHSFTGMPNQLRVSFGETRLNRRVNMLGLVLIVPGVVLGATVAGVTGAAIAAALTSCAMFLVVARFGFDDSLPDLRRQYLRDDIVLPLAAAGAVTLAWRWALPDDLMQGWPALPLFALVSATTLVAALAAAPACRQAAAQEISRLRKRAGR
ncbi:Membrane protein involved in the export of O-antigen and teichoic acid [Devosia enhydra]|uniref:Membrane protein involved in the export of O-antigen and teichoic acid n=1 Tax=Devosia enhydra TaxID=665118 RepID=A0A1K2HU05_9HYPH|nr:hypothetical protein [Devosia enhydra]SFZ81850.1 Membrane protein involved in the export of O-antigen and teichoic acid [Devosia enhydra]